MVNCSKRIDSHSASMYHMGGAQWQGEHVLVWSDNIVVVQIISGLSSKDPLLTHFLRLLYFFLAVHTIKLQAKHIPGVHNTVADALSRNQLSVFFQLHPAASRTPTAVPNQLTMFRFLNRKSRTLKRNHIYSSTMNLIITHLYSLVITCTHL